MKHFFEMNDPHMYTILDAWYKYFTVDVNKKVEFGCVRKCVKGVFLPIMELKKKVKNNFFSPMNNKINPKVSI